MRERKQKELKDLNLLDKFLFDEAVAAPGFLEDVLSIILERDVELNYPPQSEREVRMDTGNREVRLDVWAEDTLGTIHDTEVQKENKGNLPKRFRLYHSLIASKLLARGFRDFKPLNDVVVIVIAPFDLFGENRCRYTFHMSCDEVPGLQLNDGMTTIFLNTRGTVRDGVTDELVELLKYFEETTEENAENSTSERIKRLQKQIQRIRVDEKVGIRFMNRWEEEMEWREEGLEEGRKEGREEGREEGRIELLASLVREDVLTTTDAAGKAEMSLEEFRSRAGLEKEEKE